MNRLTEILAQQRLAARSAPSTVAERIGKLRALRTQLERYQDVFADAVSADFGGRPHFESRLIEVIGTLWVLDHARRHIKKWMKPERRSPAGPLCRAEFAEGDLPAERCRRNRSALEHATLSVHRSTGHRSGCWQPRHDQTTRRYPTGKRGDQTVAVRDFFGGGSRGVWR